MAEADFEDDPPDELLLQARVDYDLSASREYGADAVVDSAIGQDFAQTVRLLHDVLGSGGEQLMELPKSVARPEWELPKPFGRFQAIEKLGQGAFGAVWKAYDPVLKMYVAIKALHPELRQISTLHERFEHEAQAAARLNHPNIVRVFEVGSIESISYIVTEFVDGAPLQIFHNGQLAYSQRNAARLVCQLADAAHHSHLQGVLHRDIKPENILLASMPKDHSGNIPRLTDFGLARLVDRQSSSSGAGMLVGSFDYMAPEQLMGQSDLVGPHSDIYALGVVLFQLLTGQLPRQADGNLFQAIEASHTPRDPRSIEPTISRDLAAICLKCLAFDVKDRFQTALDLRDDLNNFLENRPTITRPLSRAELLSRWAKMHRTAALTLLLVASSIVTVLFVSLYASYVLSQRNTELAEARDASSLAQSLSQEHESRFRKLAWNSGLQLAFDMLERGQLHGLSIALKSIAGEHEDAVRRPEWKLLNAELESYYKLLHTEPVPLREVVAIPNTSLLAIAGDQPNILLYDYSKNTILKRISIGIQEVHALAASPDGKLIAVGGSTSPSDDSARPLIIDWATESIVQTEISGPTTIESLKFSPAGNFLAIGFRYENVQIADCKSLSAATSVIPASRRCRAVDWMSENVTVVHSDQSTLLVTDLQSQQRFVHDFPEQIETFAVARNGGWLCATNAISDGCTLVSGLESSNRLFLTGIQKRAECLTISPDEKWIAAGTDLGEVVVWEVPNAFLQGAMNSDAEIAPISRKVLIGGGVTSLTWIEGALVIAGESGELVRWSPINAVEQHAVDHPTTAATFTTSDQVALGLANGEVRLIDMRHLSSDQSLQTAGSISRTLLRFDERTGTINSLFRPNPQHLWASLANGTDHRLVQIKLPELNTEGSFFVSHSENKIANVSTDLSSDGKWLAWGGSNNQLSIVNQQTREVEFSEEFTGDIYSLRFLNSRLLCVGGEFEGLRVFDIESRLHVATLGTTHVGGLYIDHSNNTITAGFKDGFLRSWSIGSWEPVYSLRTNESFIESVCQNPDGALGVAIDDQSNVVAFSPKQRMVYGRLRENQQTRNLFSHTRMSSQFSPDGQKLLLLLNFFKDDQIKSILRIYDLGLKVN